MTNTHVTLYDDQSELVDGITAKMRSHKSILAQAATGFGKTRLAAHMIDRTRRKGNRAGFMVPRRELLRQTAETMDDLGIPYGYVAAGKRYNPFAKVHLMTTGTVARRLDTAPQLDVLFVDEAHFGGGDLDRVIRHYQAMGAWVIGLSATPMKTNGQGMGEWYDAMVSGPSIQWLIDNKRLSDYRLFAPDTPDLSALRVSGGDYVKKDVDGYMMSDERGKVLVGNAAKHYSDHAHGLRNVVFCTSIKHAEMTSSMFNERGVPTTFVHGKLDESEIIKRVRAFARREVMALCNVELLTFGFDLAQAAQMDVTVEALSDLRPTKSLPLQLQKWGRALRMKDFHAMIFDHAGNSAPDLHGLPDTDRHWTLAARDKRKRGSSEKTEPTRQCSECFYVHRPSPECPNCGHVYPVQSRVLDEVDGDLKEVTERGLTPRQEQGKVASEEGLSGLIRLGRERGYKNPHAWAAKVMSARNIKRRS